jgi:hypothetical protein
VRYSPPSIFGQQDGNGENLRRTKVSDEIPLIKRGEERTAEVGIEIANSWNARHRSTIRAPPPLPQMYVFKVWEFVCPEGLELLEAIHS